MRVMRLASCRPGGARDASEAAWRAVLERARRHGWGGAAQIEAVAGVCECLFERGAVTTAGDWLDEHLGLVSADARLSWYAAWAALLAGHPDRATALVAGLAPFAGVLPQPLVELRERVAEWRPLLGGSTRGTDTAAPVHGSGQDPAPASVQGAEWERGSLGAAVLALFALGPSGERELVDWDLAPALEGRAKAWLEERALCARGPGEPERELAARARTLVRHRIGRDALRGALSPRSASFALVPVLDDSAEVAGWLHVECEHHLLPSRARLERLARQQRARLLGAVASVVPATTGGSPRVVGERRAAADGRVQAVETWVAGLRLKTTRRRWWFFDAGPPVPGTDAVGGALARELELVAEGGGALCGWTEARGQARAASRALALAVPIEFTEPDSSLSLAAEAASGVALPVLLDDRPRGVLVVESERRRDFPAGVRERLARAARAFALDWRVAQFRSWHRGRFGHDVFVAAGEHALGTRLADAVGAARARAPVAIWGPRGSGRGVFARWLHFGAAPQAPFLRLDARRVPAAEIALRLEDTGEVVGGTLFLEGLDELQAERQCGLADVIGRFVGVARWVASLREAPSQSLGPELARVFGRLVFAVEPLACRRNEIPALSAVLARRFAEEEGARVPRLSDDALALLWRQPWPGNVEELASFVYQLVVYHAGEEVDAEGLAELAQRLGLGLARRLSSRRPDVRDVRSALELTRKRSGAWNKRRAALYLGWDPDTLLARLRASGLVPDTASPRLTGDPDRAAGSGRARQGRLFPDKE